MSSVLITSDEYDHFCAMQWKPIETAPKDGSCVLAWFDDAEHHFLLYWLNDAWRFKGTHINPIIEPTHWMPLPEPPK
jgi:hypothetical protein